VAQNCDGASGMSGDTQWCTGNCKTQICKHTVHQPANLVMRQDTGHILEGYDFLKYILRI
jgi:hypothetical protein